MSEYELKALPNGIRVVHKPMNHSKIAHVGIMLDIGSRDENPNELGIAHFLEHMAFKGTHKRKAFHILNRLESLGGELNAYTTKEKICFYASVLDNHLEKAIELLADITFHSTFPPMQIEKERMVILEEMSMYRDTPEDAIQDDFDELLFPGHILGQNVLGTEASVKSFRQQHFSQFLQRNLNTEKVIISGVGSFGFAKFYSLVERYLKEIPHKNHTEKRILFDGYRPGVRQEIKPISQAHVAMGKTAYGLKSENRVPFFLLVNILGGPGMNSRLNLTLREKYGYVYGIDAHYSPYIEVGAFSIFFATDPRNLKKSIQLVEKELEHLQKKPLGDVQLHRAKQQIKGQLAMSEENNNSVMLMMAKSVLDLGHVPDLNDLFDKIDRITSAQLMELARESLALDKLSRLVYLPE